MEFHENELYHIYNRGNNKHTVFFKPDNYIYFLRKVRKFILPHCDILNYCLMPTHFHFLIHVDQRTIQTKRVGLIEKNILSEGIRNLLQTYAKAINKQNQSTGSLFQQNTKAKCISEGSKLYGEICFHYNHQNPMKARLVKKMEDWDYSSFKDYTRLRNGTLCNQALAFQLLDINPKTLYQDSYRIIDDEMLNNIF
ncbi:MAG: transposase [Chitinophagaceae bacterium]|nr:transposase [Chitinophagaceae bacterium]